MGKTIILIIALACNISAQNKLAKYVVYNTASNRISIINVDSLLSNYRTKHSPLNVSLQALVGEGIGIGTAIIPFSFGFVSAFGGSKTTGDILGAISIPVYILGTASGVHWMAHIENKDHSYWKTVMFATIGAGVGAALSGILASKYRTIPDAGVAIIMLCPLAGSLVYSLAYADWPRQNLSTVKYGNFEMSNRALLFKDLVDQSQIIKINLLRINL